MKRTFSLRTILTVTTGRLLAESKGPKDNGIGNLYELLNHMTQGNLLTHQLLRAGEEYKSWLLRWFPELVPVGDGATLDKWMKNDNAGGLEAIKMWIAELKLMFPAIRDKYEVEPISQDDHERKDAYDELVEMRGTDEGILIVYVGGSDQS